MADSPYIRAAAINAAATGGTFRCNVHIDVNVSTDHEYPRQHRRKPAGSSLLRCWRLCFNRSVDQHYQRHRRSVASTRPQFQDSHVTARALFESRAEILEQLADHFLVTEATKRQPPIGNAINLGQGYQRLDDASQFLGLGYGGLNRLMSEQRRSHVAEHGFAM